MSNNYTMNVSTIPHYCDLQFTKTYVNIHGYLSILVCVFGSIANVLNICVLTTKEMRWPTNLILTALAIADLLVMLEYIPFASHMYLQTKKQASYFSYAWAVYICFHALFTQVFHFVSCCLTVILAIWRYIAITKPQYKKVWRSHERTLTAIFLSYILCPFICTPLYLGLAIEEVGKYAFLNNSVIWKKNVDPHDYNETLVNKTIYVTKYNENYEQLNFYLYSVVIKLFPCILLTVLSILLIKALLDAKKRFMSLFKSSETPLVNGKAAKIQRIVEKEQQANRTTKMLLAVLLLFLLTEFPQAMLGLLAAILGENFTNSCYKPLGDLMDIFALTNSAINFILYCSMSQQFRASFSRLFIPECLSKSGSKNGSLSMTQLTNV